MPLYLKDQRFRGGRARRRALGQNILVSNSVADKIIECAKIRKTDKVFEIGTGTGILTERLAQLAMHVTSYEIDRVIFEIAKPKLSRFGNVNLVLGDAFSVPETTQFDLCVSSIPYSRSLEFVEWISQRACALRAAVVLVQKEFADKIASRTGSRNYRSVSVICQSCFSIEMLATVSRSAFSPPPHVLSCIIRLIPRDDLTQNLDRDQIILFKKLFSFRGRLVRTALKKTGLLDKLYGALSEDLLATRVEKLKPSDFLLIARGAE